MTTKPCVPKNIRLGMDADYSAWKGPCPTGFHIPSLEEFNKVVAIMGGTGQSSTHVGRYQKYLHFPPCYYLNRSSGAKNTSYGVSRYWTNYMTSNTTAYCFSINENNNISTQTDKPANGFSLRAFKDVPVVPDSTWTDVDPTSADIGSGKIFYKSADGLISLTDGVRRITIQDKNVGATTVWNDGDTVDDNNAGLFFQFGNNNGFPYSGATSFYTSTQTVAGYGPGNWYSDSHFVKVSYNNRFTGSNNNIWGGATKIIAYKECRAVYLGNTLIRIGNSDMKGPCPDFFHIPLYTEWGDLCNILTNILGLSSSWNTAKTYLKLPPAGRRLNTTSEVDDNRGNYWASTAKGTDNGYIFYFNELNFLPTSATSRCMGISIRPFRDVCVIPDGTWTTLYDGSGIAPGAGIFHNSTLGLISISGDGTNRTTIADKNVGATTVYNSGDTLSEANCGKFYQWGNNYGFPRTGTIANQSTTQVNASSYGPLNYYSSDTFIKYNGRWDTTNNGNLWGGVSQGIWGSSPSS